MFAVHTIISFDIFTDVFNYYIKDKVAFAESTNRYLSTNFIYQLPVFAIGIMCYFIYNKIMDTKNINR